MNISFFIYTGKFADLDPMKKKKTSSRKSRRRHVSPLVIISGDIESPRQKAKLEESQAHSRPGESLIKVAPSDLVDFFPTTDHAVLNNIQLTEESLYSSTTLAHANYIRDIIKMYYPTDEHNDLVITDATSCVGGTIMACIEPFGTINAVELNPLHAKIMKNNLCAVFPVKCMDVNIVNANFLSVWNTFKPKSNVVILDPPWGGCDYFKEENLKLYLNDKNGVPVELVDIINMLTGETDMVMVRIPFNYDMSRLSLIEFKHSMNFKFLKKYQVDNSRRSGKVKTLYHIYVFSHDIPRGNSARLDPHAYYATVNYRDIIFEKM